MTESTADPKVLAQARLTAIRRRVSTIRVRVAMTALAMFGVVWTVIAAQLVAGHDPALGAQASTTHSGASSTRTHRVLTSTSSAGSSGTSSSTTAPATTTVATNPAPVVTSTS